MGSSSVKRERIIDILKGVSILFVCFTHYEWKSAERKAMFFPWWVGMAVPIFMLLSGYVYEKSISRKNIDSLSKAYTAADIVSKSIRFTIPVLFVYTAMVTLDSIRWSRIPYNIFNTFLQGGRGKGAYYYPLMMQLIFVLPIIGVVIKRLEEKGLLLCLIANIVYEVLHVAYGIPVESYRFLVFRYIFVLASGCYIALGKKTHIGIPIAMFLVGAVFLASWLYAGYKPMFVVHWTGTSFVATMYIIPIIWILIRKCKFRCAPLELLGKASYNIFVIQMLYYYAATPIVYQNVESRKLQLLISMVVCVLVGVVFYYIETPVTKAVQRKVVGWVAK